MGVEDMGEGQPLPIQRGERRGGVAGVDDAHDIAARFAQQVDIIVLKRGNEFDVQGFNRHDVTLS